MRTVADALEDVAKADEDGLIRLADPGTGWIDPDTQCMCPLGQAVLDRMSPETLAYHGGKWGIAYDEACTIWPELEKRIPSPACGCFDSHREYVILYRAITHARDTHAATPREMAAIVRRYVP